MKQPFTQYNLLSSYVGTVENLSHLKGKKRRAARREKKAEAAEKRLDAALSAKERKLQMKMDYQQHKQNLKSQAIDKKIDYKSNKQDLKDRNAENIALTDRRTIRSQGRADKKRATGESNIILAEQGINARAQMAGSIMGGMAKVAGAVGGSIVGAKAVGALGGIGDKRGEAGSQLMGGVLGGNIFGNQQSSDWEDGYSTPDYLSAPRPNPYTTTQQDIYEDTQDTQPGDDNQLLTNQSNIMETIKKNKWYIIAAVVIIAAIWYNKKKK